jgi:SAM-dependent methyltransferase
MVPEEHDAFGHALADYVAGQGGICVIERDDGFLDPYRPDHYFADFENWGALDQQLIARARGRVLDLGCGPGRHCLYLQERAHEVVGVDNSRLVAQIARERGVRRVEELSATQLGPDLGEFDTILMLGNNLGFLGNEKRAPWLLRKLHARSRSGAVILGTARDCTPTPDTPAAHLAYHARNRRRGRPLGQLRLRYRYHEFRSPWFELWFPTPEELRRLTEGTGWRVGEILPGQAGHYGAVLERVD